MSLLQNRSEVYFPLAAYNNPPEDPALMRRIHNPVCNALQVIINIAALTSGTVQFIIEGYDELGNTFLLLASAALAATGQTVLRVGPQYTAAANTIAKDYVPLKWRIRPVHGTAVGANYSVCYNLIMG